MADQGIYLDIDVSDLEEEINRLKSVMRPEQFERRMYGILRRAGGHVRQTLKTELPRKYEIRAGEVSSAVKGARMSSSAGLGVGCSIPVVGPRRDLGGTQGRGFPAYGGRKGWNVKPPYRAKVKVLKGSKRPLPFNMGAYGGEPHFRNLSAPKLNNLVFTREGKPRLPIKKVVGIAIPQMPMNRSQPEVQKDISDYMRNRIEHEFQRVIAGGR